MHLRRVGLACAGAGIAAAAVVGASAQSAAAHTLSAHQKVTAKTLYAVSRPTRIAPTPLQSVRIAVPTDAGVSWKAHNPFASAGAPSDGKVHDLGPVNKKMHTDVHVYLQLRNFYAAVQLANEVSDPTSPQYRQYITPAQFDARFAPSASTVATMSNYFKKYGLKVATAPGNHHVIKTGGHASQLEKAFNVPIHWYSWTDPSSGKTYHFAAMSKQPKLPQKILRHLLSIGGINEGDIVRTPKHVLTGMVPAAPPGQAFYSPPGYCENSWDGLMAPANLPQFLGQNLPDASCGTTPSEMRTAYGADVAQAQGITGKGVTVAILDAYASPTMKSDLAQYNSAEGLPQMASGQYQELLMSKGLYNASQYAACGPQDWYGEQSLDVEAVHTMAEDANILFVGANGCQNSQLDNAMNRVVDNKGGAAPLANVITNSWGEQGESFPAGAFTWDNLFVQAADEGVSVLFSSGDGGDEAQANNGRPMVDSPSSSPFVTAVGGTTLRTGPGGTYLGEDVWGTQKAFYNQYSTPPSWGDPYFVYGGGGGPSSLYMQPSWQRGVVPSAMALSQGAPMRRTTPDVALAADPNAGGLMVGMSQTSWDNKVFFQLSPIGGTSEASPLFAGVVADADQAQGGTHGLLNPAIYRMAGTNAFRDVVASPSELAMMRMTYSDPTYPGGDLIPTVRTIGQDGTLKAVTGYDTGTGNGSPRVQNFANELGK